MLRFIMKETKYMNNGKFFLSYISPAVKQCTECMFHEETWSIQFHKYGDRNLNMYLRLLMR